MYNSKSFDISYTCETITKFKIVNIPVTSGGFLVSLGTRTPIPSPLVLPPLGDHWPAFCTINWLHWFGFSRAVYEWNHTVCTLCLAAFTQCNYFEMNIWVGPSSGLEQRKPLWTFMYMSLCRHMFSFTLGK